MRFRLVTTRNRSCILEDWWDRVNVGQVLIYQTGSNYQTLSTSSPLKNDQSVPGIHKNDVAIVQSILVLTMKKTDHFMI